MSIYLLSRTRQFGKSLVLGTLKGLCGDRRELFDELEAPQAQERSALNQ